MFADFVLDGVGEIINQIAKMQYMSSGRLKMPILLRGCIGIGHSAATHHSGNYYPMFAHFPGLRVVVPSTPYDAKGLLHHALRCDDPVLFLEHRELLALKGPVPEEDYEIPFGQAAVVREGKDVTVVALALHGARRRSRPRERWRSEGISVEVIDPRTVAPLDIDTIRQSVREDGPAADRGRGVRARSASAPRSRRRSPTRGFDDLDAPIRRLQRRCTRRRRTARRWRPPSSRTPQAIVAGDPRPAGGVSSRCRFPSPIPRLGWNMEEGTFVGWLKADGDAVRPGEALFRLEGEKATEEIESLDAGMLHIPADGPKPGDRVAVGAVIGYLLQPGEAAPERPTRAASVEPPDASRAGRAASTGDRPALTPERCATTRRRSHARAPGGSPRELGVDWSQAARQRPQRPRPRARRRRGRRRGRQCDPLTPIRQAIAARMVESRQTTAPVTLTTTVDATNLVNLREQFKADGRAPCRRTPTSS